MKTLTVQPGVSRSVVTDGVPRWINNEMLPLLSQMRDALNYRTTQKRERVVTAGDGALTAVWTSPVMPRTALWVVDAQIIGVGATQRVAYHLLAVAESSDATLTMRDQFLTTLYESATDCDVEADIDASARTVVVKARDDGAEAMYWTTWVSVLEGT